MFTQLMETAPATTTDRLALRPLAQADSYPLFSASLNPRFNEHLMWSQPDDHDAVAARVQTIMMRSRAHELAALSAVIKETGQWVSLYRLIQTGATEAEMGLWTHPDYWSGGYGTELTRAVIDLAFKTTTFNTLMAAASPNNPGACAVLRKCGLTPDVIEHRPAEDGQIVPLIQFRINRPL